MSVRQGNEGFGAWVMDRLPSVRDGRRRGEPPEVEVRGGPSVPSVVLRAVVAAVSVAAVLVAVGLPGADVPDGLRALLVAVALLPALAPRWPTAALVVLAVGVRVLTADPVAAPWLAVLVLLVHALVRLTPVAARTTWRTRVEVAVLGDGLRGALAVQAGAQGLALVASALAGAGAGATWRVAGLAAVLGLTALALVRPVRPWWQGRPED